MVIFLSHLSLCVLFVCIIFGIKYIQAQRRWLDTTSVWAPDTNNIGDYYQGYLI